MKDFSEKLSRVPMSPGVYLMKDEGGNVIYVGKAKKLKNRVSSYFNGFESQARKTQRLVMQIEDFEYIITKTEVEALILEGNLIKKHLPRYNILLKDDKSFPYLKITNEEYPRLLKVREVKKDGAAYFGPFTKGLALNRTIELIKRIYPIRKCNRNMERTYKKSCLYHNMGMCLAPCVDKGRFEEYKNVVKEVETFLKKGSEDLLKHLEFEMNSASAELKFERAAMLRDEIDAIKQMGERQSVSSLKEIDMDVIACSVSQKFAIVVMLFVRNGIVSEREKYVISNTEEATESEVLGQFVLQYYSGTGYIPSHIELMKEIPDASLNEDLLSKKRGTRVSIHVPKRGERKRIMDMAATNANELINRELETEIAKKQKKEDLLLSLKKLISLEKVPHRIELYDISNIMGIYSVGAMVVFENAQKKSNDYRKFKIKSEGKIDDYGAMMEVLYRRHRRAIEGGAKAAGFEHMADLIIMDGGKGHVGVAKEVLTALGLDIPVAGLVKDKSHRTRALYYGGREYELDKHGNIFRFLAGMQEEVHRFAIGYHKQLRTKGMLHSALDDIAGIGQKRKTALLQKFGSLEGIKNAKYEDIAEIQELNDKVATSVYDYFHRED